MLGSPVAGRPSMPGFRHRQLGRGQVAQTGLRSSGAGCRVVFQTESCMPGQPCHEDDAVEVRLARFRWRRYRAGALLAAYFLELPIKLRWRLPANTNTSIGLGRDRGGVFEVASRAMDK